MKKFFLTALALVMMAGSANAFEFEYEPEPGFSYMGLFGMNVTKLQNRGYGTKAGAMMGARADYMLPGAKGTYLTAGLDWTMKGGKTSVWTMDEHEATMKYALHYFEIPLRVGFRYNIMEELGVYAEVGPYFAVGVGGRHKCSIGDGAAISEIEDEFTFKAFKNTYDPEYLENQTFQRWDSGVGFRIGAEYNNHFNFMLGCDWGLADIYRNNLRNDYFDKTGYALPKVHNFNFSMTFGYRF
ncbi:MAG: PorT family protein [Bacteroidaceae bacterium]|nr:PorT family protein [Bacteroidaceae bacterium]